MFTPWLIILHDDAKSAVSILVGSLAVKRSVRTSIFVCSLFVAAIQELGILAVALRNVPAQYNHKSLLVGVGPHVFYPLEWWVEIKLQKICWEEVPYLKGLILANTIKQPKPSDVCSQALKGHEWFIKGLVPDKHALNWLALTDLLRYAKLAEI
jgi:hypothetical protein